MTYLNGERTNNFSDYDHGLFFYVRSISEERRSMIEKVQNLTDEEKIQFREFMHLIFSIDL